jgi:hypothetical protein
VDTLQDVVEGLSETFVGVNDALLASGSLSRDPEMARVLKEGMERFLALSMVAQQETGDDFEATSDQDVEDPLAGALASPTASEPEQGSGTGDLSRQELISNQRFSQTEWSASRNGSFSPRLSYGVWNGFSSDSSSPSGTTNNVLHYITAGHDSFAARLYWNSLTLAFRSLRGDEDFPIDFAKSMFRYKMRYSTPQQVLMVIAHVLNQMLLGTNDITFDPSRSWEAFTGQRTLPDPSESGAVETNAVKNAIHRDIIQDGGMVDDYLDTWSVERYLANKWGVVVDSSTARPSQRSFVMDVNPLLESLTAAAVTIGEGPRYPKAEIDSAVQVFLTETHCTEGID